MAENEYLASFDQSPVEAGYYSRLSAAWKKYPLRFSVTAGDIFNEVRGKINTA